MAKLIEADTRLDAWMKATDHLLDHGSMLNLIPVLNQVVRTFTAKWHRESLTGAFGNMERRKEFRKQLQADLRNYNRFLAEIAGVEDLTDLQRSDEGK